MTIDTADGSNGKAFSGILEVSNFLNQFQKHFLPELLVLQGNNNKVRRPADNDDFERCNKYPLGVISPRDLENVLKFRTLLEKFRTLEDELYVADQYGDDERIATLTHRYTVNKREEFENLNKQMQSISGRTKLLLTLLHRFEVWISKVVAQDQLVTSKESLSEAAKLKIDQRFSSPFINLPLSSYFEEILPPIELEQEEERSNNSSTLSNSLSKSVFYKQNRCIECCTLPLPPNKNTWEAYAKLSIMVSILSESDFLERDSAGDEDGSGDIVTTVSSFKHNKNELLLHSLKSPACIYEFNRFKKGQNPSQRSDYTFSLSDVIPIWIRAQRNTQALRQLFLLFEVQLQPPTNKINGRSDPNKNRTEKSTASTSSVSTSILGTGMRGVGKRLILNMTETDDNDNDTQEHPHKERIQGIITNTTEEYNDLQYNAKFRGNPSSIRSQMTDISNYVDRLVEWAVINQSIFTYRRIKKQIWTAPLLNPKENQISNGRRRRRDSIRANPAKRMRIDEIDDENHTLFELRQACESFILRLFARRNRNALTILFSSRNEDSLDIGCLMNKKVLKQAAVLKQSNVAINMKEYMQTLSNTKKFHFEDRTFARIDRRLFIKGRYYGSSAAVSCRSNLSVLLESLSNVLPENQGSHKKLVASAKEDLEKLFGAFLMTADDNESDNNSNADSNENGSAIYETALKLIAPPKGFTQQYLTAVLKSSPAPWVEKCWKCNAAGRKLHTCLNCEHVFHQECSSSGSATGRHIGLKTLIQSFSPLNDLVKKREPKNLEPPNFSTSSQWIEKTINISRQIESDGFMSRLGITFESSDDCSTYFDALQSKNVFDIARKMNEDENDSSGRKCRTPLRIRYAGCLLTSVKQGYCAEQAGLQKGDIITGLEFGKCVDDNDKIMHGKSGKFDLSNGTHETFVTLFKVKSPVMMVTVRRPPINIVEMAKNWYTVITKLNKVTLDVLRGLNDSSFWYCGTCTQSQVCNASKGVFLEAECCRAVIRRIGMESYSQPFLEGNQKDESGFFCLRRLDSIMTHIMRIQSKDDSYESFPEAFLTPPIGNSIRHRLGWAKKELEKRPMELLCNAMKTFMTSSFSGVSQFATKRNAFIRHFLVTFSSWCVGSIKREMAGPPDVFRYAQPPWIGASCSVCCSRPVINHDVFTCANQLCVNHSTRSERHIDDINNKEITKVGNSMSDYSKRAALVGTSFLVLPVDPLVQYVSKVVRIEHENRPVEFIVASYLPPDYYDIVVNGRQKTSCDQFEKGDGIYHLLPVVNARQQLFLLERCKIRDKRENDKESNLLWASLDVLNLDGVARYSPTALQKKINVSNAIRFAIDRVIIQHRDVCKSLTDSFDSSLHSQTANESRLNMLQYFSAQKSRDCNLDIQNSLISTLLKGKATTQLVRLLFHSDSTDEEILSVEAEADIDSSSWKIIQPENAPCELKFGLSSAQKGLIPINGISPSSQILLPSSVLEGESILYYSDFLYENETVKKNIANSLLPPKLLPYEGKPDNKYFEMRFNLAKLDSSGTNNIFGWGFEILKWKNDERILQVGRVKRGSPAHNVGLRPYDIISSINGRKFTKFYKISDFVTSIMGVPNVKVRMDEKQDRVEKILMLLSTIKDSKIKSSPVEICVYRVSSVHNHDNQCQAAVSRLQTSVQSTIRQQGLPHTNLKRSYDTDRSRSLITESQRGATINVQTKIPVIRNPLPTLDINARVNPCAHVNPSYAHSNANSSVNSNANSNANSNSNANANANANLNQANFVHRNSTTNTAINHRASTREKSRKEATMKLVQLLKNSYHERRPFQQSDLYRAARNGLVLTIMEVSLFLESLFTGAWKLGMRLLMPRYDVHIIVEQVKKIVMFTREMVLAVPIIGKNNYQHLLQLDFDRMNDRNDPETGDFILKEVTNGVEYKYRLPVKPLPIDRNIEIQYQHQVTHQHSIHHQHPTAQQYQQRQYQYPASHHQQRWQSHRNEHHARNSEWSNIDHRRQNDNANQMQTTVIDLLGSEDRNLSAVDELGGKIDEPSLTMYNEGVCNSRGVYTNSGSSNRQAVSRVAPYPSERIRGGGGEPDYTAIDQSTDICLNEIPVQDWNQKPVYTLVQTLSEGSLCSEADEDILVGFARKSSDGVISNKVKVEAYYLSSIGYFAATKVSEFYVEDVYIVDTNYDSEESKVIAKLQSKKIPHNLVEGDRQNSLSSIHKAGDHPHGEMETEDEMKKNARALVTSFSDLQSLGKLPDGRDIVWLSNDPIAIYVEGFLTREVEQSYRRQFHSNLRQNQETLQKTCPDVTPLKLSDTRQYTCLWGCSMSAVDGKRQCLAFSSEIELYRHYSSYHFCRSKSSVTVVLGEEGREFIRIDGKRVVEFSSALTGAIVARLPLLVDRAQNGNSCQELESGMEFFTSPTGNTLQFPANKNMFDFCISQLSDSCTIHSKHSNNLVQLWSRIAKLFECNTTGKYRLDQDLRICPETNQNKNLHDDSACLQYDRVILNSSCEDKPAISWKGFQNCSLCSLPFEKYLPCSSTEEGLTDKKDDSYTNLRRNIGCSLMSDAVFKENQQCHLVGKNIPGNLGKGKMLLLKVARLIPESVKLTVENSQREKLNDPLNSYRVFDSDLNYSIWMSFVAECKSSKMLAQALVSLLASIKRSKLPDWWSRENSGWSTSYAIMAESSLSTLHLHIYTLDAALTDILSRSLHEKFEQQRKPDEIPFIQRKKMNKLWKLAMSYGYEPFEGTNFSECFHCNDGGTLLCCELCPRVQHHECCVPQLVQSIKLDHWICDSCVNDIENYEDGDEEFEDQEDRDFDDLS